MKRFVYLLAAAVSVSATLSAQQPNAAQPQRGGDNDDKKEITVIGCLQAGAQQNQFVLNVTPDPIAKGVAVATSGAVPNVTYMLSGGSNLGAHVGHRVSITGHSSGKSQTAVAEDRNVSAAKDVPNSPDPKVVVKEKAAIDVRDLHVGSLKMVSTSCDAK